MNVDHIRSADGYSLYVKKNKKEVFMIMMNYLHQLYFIVRPKRVER